MCLCNRSYVEKEGWFSVNGQWIPRCLLGEGGFPVGRKVVAKKSLQRCEPKNQFQKKEKKGIDPKNKKKKCVSIVESKECQHKESSGLS